MSGGWVVTPAVRGGGAGGVRWESGQRRGRVASAELGFLPGVTRRCGGAWLAPEGPMAAEIGRRVDGVVRRAEGRRGAGPGRRRVGGWCFREGARELEDRGGGYFFRDRTSSSRSSASRPI
jgi:hypothetical protein